jgi:hypothetical protein
MNVDYFFLCFRLLILVWKTATLVLKANIVTFYLMASVLWHSKKTLVNFIRRLNKLRMKVSNRCTKYILYYINSTQDI